MSETRFTPGPWELTKKQREVLEALADGCHSGSSWHPTLRLTKNGKTVVAASFVVADRLCELGLVEVRDKYPSLSITPAGRAALALAEGKEEDSNV